MPVYEYICNNCREEFEKLVYTSTVVCCPKCASVNIRKRMSAFGMSGVEKPFAGGKDGCSSCSKGSCGSCK